MDMKVFWTETSLENLENIFDYLKHKVSLSKAKKVVTSIIDRTIQLENQPESGAKEQLLKSRGKEYRYLIEGNYKIIYWIEEGYVKIATVYDTRQYPLARV